MITVRNHLQAWWCVTLPQWIAGLLSRRIVHFATVRLFAAASTGKFTDRTPDGIDIWEALGAWAEPTS